MARSVIVVGCCTGNFIGSNDEIARSRSRKSPLGAVATVLPCLARVRNDPMLSRLAAQAFVGI